MARAAITAAGVAPLVTVNLGPCQEWRLLNRPRLLMCNPPWGMRDMETWWEAGGGGGLWNFLILLCVVVVAVLAKVPENFYELNFASS